MRATVCNRLPSVANTINSSFEYGYKAFPLSVGFLPGHLPLCLYGQPLWIRIPKSEQMLAVPYYEHARQSLPFCNPVNSLT